MRPGGAVFGSLIGAGGVTAYNTYHSSDWGIVKTLQWWIEKGQADTARASNPELARLEDMVGRLTRDMASRGREVHYMPAQSGAGYSTFYIVSGGVVISVAYLRVWRGWTFSSMLPVTKEALKSGLSTIRSGVDGLSRKIQEVKDFVDERVEALSRKQDSLGDSQDAMKGQLDDVQDGVQQMRGDLGRLEGDMKGLRDNQLFCNEGILTLCSSLREIISGGQKSKYTSVATLDSFINRSKHMPLPQHAGLASILPGSEAAPFPPAGRAITGRNRANSPVSAPGTALTMATRTQSESLSSSAIGLSRFGSFGFGSRAAFRESNENIKE
ncbi:hypothetical protein ABBQ32_003294 [Trebouxia sp. C0010 RCD-2024]